MEEDLGRKPKGKGEAFSDDYNKGESPFRRFLE